MVQIVDPEAMCLSEAQLAGATVARLLVGMVGSSRCAWSSQGPVALLSLQV
jgi:hypothetical protein